MKRFTLVTFLLSAVPFFFENVKAQQPYFEEQVFPSPTSEITLVNGIAADINNCIWLTTQSGVYRYDGNRFRQYSSFNTPSIKFERMESMQRVLKNRDISWCIRDAKSNLYSVDSLSRLRSFSTDENTEIVFGSYSLQAWKQGKKLSLSIPTDSIAEVYHCRMPNQFYIVLQSGYVVTISASQLVKGGKPTPVDSTFRLQTNLKQIIATDNSLYNLSARGIFRINSASSSPQEVSLTGDILYTGKELNYENMHVFLPPGQRSILLWYKGNIYELSESLQSSEVKTRLLANGSPTNIPSFLYYSSEHQLLMGCFLNKGLVLYKPKQFSLLSYTDSLSHRSLNYYYVLLPADSGYITVNNSGIVWLGLNGTSRLLSRGRYSIFFLHRDKAGNIWYHKSANDKEGTPEQVGYLEAGTDRPVFVFSPGENNLLSGIYQSNDSTYYILTNHTFQKIIHKAGKFITEILLKHQSDKDLNMLFARDAKTLWIGYDQGLLEFTIADKKIKPVAALENANVRTITKLAANNFLIGTYDKWIYQYKDGEWSHLSSSDKTVAPSAHAFIIDSSSNSLWVSSNNGISRLSLQNINELNGSPKGEIYVEHFTGFGEGIATEFNGSSNVSSARLSDTSAAFANATGLVVFNPRFAVSPPLPHNVLVEPIYKNDGVEKNDSESSQLQFRVVVPYFGNRGNLEILYRLSDADDDWNLLFPNDVISYNHLKPGRHDLQFRIRHYSDIKGEEVIITSNSFFIPYKWYQTLLFKIGIIILFIGLLVFLHNFRIWYILKRKKELETLVQLKTGELQETNENLVGVINELSLSEANLKQSNFLKDEYYAVLTHDLRSPLKFLSFNIGQLLELLPELKHDALRKGLLASYQCSTDVSKLIDEFVYWIEDNEKQLKAQPAPANIRAIVEDTKKIYGFDLDGNTNTFINDIPHDLIFMTDPKLLFIILRNAVDNANKYTTGGTITVSAIRQNAILQLTVADTGRGINEEKARLLMDLQYGDVQLSYKQRRSLGFYIMAMLIKKLGGNYTISNTNEKGTSLCFTIPELKE